VSWFSDLAKTYDSVANIAGMPNEQGKVLWPMCHIAAKTNVAVTIDQNGRFRHAVAEEMRIIVPCTKESAVRGSEPHALHDQLKYLTVSEMYLDLLKNWKDSHPKVDAVYKYVVGGSLIKDLQNSEISTKDDKIFVRFRVEIPGDSEPNLWEDKGVIKAWQDYCETQNSEMRDLCYATGNVENVLTKHYKGINVAAANAKLVSSSDKDNYTYRGRFKKATEANAISADASCKTHAMLNYIIETQAYRSGTQAIAAWNIDSGKPEHSPFESSFGLVHGKSQNDLTNAEIVLDSDYSKNWRSLLMGTGNVKSLKNRLSRVAVMAVDAATTGRMGITFYQNLPENDYIERIVNWHETCAWHFRRNGQNYVSAPSANRIINVVYGEPKSGNDEGYKKIQKLARERLLYHIICGEPLNRSWIKAATERVSRQHSYESETAWLDAISVTCALVRKYYHRKGEEFSLNLEKDRQDRSYLFGRLLAIGDRLESHARYLQAGGEDKRPTNAVRYMSAFAAKPLRTWKLIFDQLNPYIQRLDGAEWYQRQIDEVMSLFNEGDFDDRQLDGRYLMGYSLQRLEFFNKKDEDKNKEENNESDQEN